MSSDMSESALSYAARGYKVFPLYGVVEGVCVCRAGSTCGSPGKHPRTGQGYKDASADPAIVGAWQWKEANIGVALDDNFVVLDVDPRNGGGESLAALQKSYGALPLTPTVETGGQGWHYYFAVPPKSPRLRNAPIAPGLDFKSSTGHVVAPPSVHISGLRYAWMAERSLDDCRLAEIPTALLVMAIDGNRGAGAALDAAQGVERAQFFKAFVEAGIAPNVVDVQKAIVDCPFIASHSTGTEGDGSTVLFGATEPEGRGYIHCSHEHCRNRNQVEFWTALTGTAWESTRTPRTAKRSAPKACRASLVQPEHVEWIWRGRFPKGKIVLIEGDPGNGKSAVAYDLVGRVTGGMPMPLEAEECEIIPRGAVIMASEEGLADSILPRLVAAGADLNRINAYSLDDLPQLPEDMASIEAAIKEVDAAMLVIDPLSGFTGRADINKETEIRRIMTPLGAMAERTGVCVAIVRHLNKNVDTTRTYRGGGSIAIIAAARSALRVDPESDEGDIRLLSHVKINIGPTSAPVRFELEGVDDTVRVRWIDTVASSAPRVKQRIATRWCLSTGVKVS
ncbi:bifunctional DNA primase/polymerase [Candidatus Binatia bacterium]|nr:bifunctional DNA primase/polymerase [Candidatus Binatia bacterium]